jgi:hypothetical protein
MASPHQIQERAARGARDLAQKWADLGAASSMDKASSWRRMARFQRWEPRGKKGGRWRGPATAILAPAQTFGVFSGGAVPPESPLWGLRGAERVFDLAIQEPLDFCISLPHTLYKGICSSINTPCLLFQ